jgi:acyl-ACP thioesterase
MMQPLWETTFLVGFGAVDRSDRLTLAGAFDYFQDAAINHAEALGIGRNAMSQTGQVWILSRMSVRIERRPGYREKITVRSWPRGWEKLFALREYDIRDAADRAVAQGSAAWLILDWEKRRPLRPGPLMAPLPRNEEAPLLQGGAANLEARNGLCKTGGRRALYSDIDYNGHVNNTRYIQWIQDALEMETLEQADRMAFDINYLGEIKSAEGVELWTEREGRAKTAFEGRREGDGRPVFRAELRVAP